MKWLRRCASAFLLASCVAGEAAACPVCASETGAQVRAGIFNDEFASNLLAILLPFPIVLGVAAGLHFGCSPRGGSNEGH